MKKVVHFKTKAHTGKPDCCAMCENFHQNMVLTGKATTPSDEAVAKEEQALNSYPSEK